MTGYFKSYCLAWNMDIDDLVFGRVLMLTLSPLVSLGVNILILTNSNCLFNI